MAKYVVKKEKSFTTKSGYAKIGDVVELGDDTFTKSLIQKWIKNGVIAPQGQSYARLSAE